MPQPRKRDAEMGQLVPFPDRAGELIASPGGAGEELAGELVDADGDGFPDTRHGAALEPQTSEVVDAELLTDAEYRAARQRRIVEARPVVPTWMSDPAQRAEFIRWSAMYAGHRTRYHGVRVPLYLLRVLSSAPRGIAFAVWEWSKWAFDREAHPLRRTALDGSDAATYLALSRQRKERVRVRLRVSAIIGGIVAVGATLAALLMPLVAWLLLVAVLIAAGVWGRRADRPIVTPATVVQRYTKLTPDVVERAFIAAKLATEASPITFAQPIQRDGQGWLAVVDMPFGKHFKQASTAREALASGLHTNAVTVFLDPDPVAARRVRLWVSDVDVFAQKPVVSPLVKAQSWDFWQPLPFGLDARDRLVTLPLVFSSLLVGAIPRMGKTFSARIPAAAAALDPTVKLLVFNGKGDAAWRSFEAVAHTYGSGVREEVVELLVSSLAELVADMNGRYERMEKLPTSVCPDAKLTPALARNRRLNMPLTMVAIDEVQRYLEHPTRGADILSMLTDLVKVGPAAGIMLVLATQKPDSKVIPDSLRGQIGTRFAMRVMTWQASETILGAGTYPAGMDASRFLNKHKGVGILLGADDGDLAERGGQTVRTHLLAGGDLDALCARGRAAREAAGLLTGMAAGEMPVTAGRTAAVLDDLAAVFAPGEDKAWSEVLVARLAERDPDSYDGWTPNQLATALKPYSVTPEQVWGTTGDGKGANRRGYVRNVVIEALAARLDHS